MEPALIADIASSGISFEDLEARQAGAPEMAAANINEAVQGYVIPYYDIKGKPIAFYRVKLLDHDPKYKQPKGSANHIYFPKDFQAALGKQILNKKVPKKYVVLTEGEKKAAAATKEGIPCVAVGGVNNWKTRTVILPPETTLSAAYTQAKAIRATLPDANVDLETTGTLAIGMRDLIDLIVSNDLYIIIAFDTDEYDGIKEPVQSAASSLGHELRFRGVPFTKIRQLVLPNGSGKMGLDDFIVQEGKKPLISLIKNLLEKQSAFPRHPNPKEFLNKKLQKGKMSRKDAQNLAMTILTELDAGGKRLHSKATNTPYYFDENTHKLMPVSMLQNHGEPLHEMMFGQLLYKDFNLSAADTRIINWLASQYTGEEPIEEVEPKRILAIPESDPDSIAYQISDSQFALVSASKKKPLQILTNGSEGLLFEQGHVDAIDPDRLMKEFEKQNKPKKIKCRWYEVLKGINIKQQEDNNHLKIFASLLYYISPWLNRWRGTQLPIEIIVGEPNSGKSSVCNLRLAILTGQSLLRNMPKDLRDWQTSIMSSGGLHVIDNVHFTNNELRQRLSDEMCRITTEPTPNIEMRKLYTTATQMRVPVNVTFAMTSIQQPFHNIDLIQRAAVLKMAAVEGSLNSEWVNDQLWRFGGRTSWLAHHLVVLHRFLDEVVNEGSWETEYRASHRLAHYEQNLSIMSDIMGFDADWLPTMLAESRDVTLSESDWALEGLKTFAEDTLKNGSGKPFPVASITEWAISHEEFEDNTQLTNVRRLGRYIQQHRQTIQRITGIREVGSSGNRKMYKVSKD